MHRLIGAFALAAVLSVSLSGRAAAPAPLSAETRAYIEPVFETFRQTDAALAALPPARDDAERLIRLGRADQAGREAYGKLDLSTLPEDQRTPAFEAIWAEIDKRDLANQTQLKALLPSEGWFLRSKYGTDAVEGAWHVMQHAAKLQPDLFRAAVQAMERLLPTGEIDKQRFAMMSDRIASMDGHYQIYGSQMVCHQHRWVPYPISDPQNLDARRKDMGFDTTFAENLKRFEGYSCAGQWDGKLPPGAKL